MRIIRIGTRGSLLAVAQAQIIAAQISRTWPDIMTELVKITTTGDKNMSPFSSDPAGIKSMFTLELEQALMNHDIDFAVHSLKDVPANINPNLPIVAYSRRADPRDALVLNDDAGALGSSSLRRRLQLERRYPDREIIPIRGNITTRLAKLDSGEFGGVVLAAAGLERLGLTHRIARIFQLSEIMPAPGQGILACQGRLDGEYEYLACVNDESSRDCAIAERSFSRALGAGCNVPIGAYAVTEGETLTLQGLFIDEKTRRFFRGEISGKRVDAEKLGQRLAEVITA